MINVLLINAVVLVLFGFSIVCTLRKPKYSITLDELIVKHGFTRESLNDPWADYESTMDDTEYEPYELEELERMLDDE